MSQDSRSIKGAMPDLGPQKSVLWNVQRKHRSEGNPSGLRPDVTQRAASQRTGSEARHDNVEKERDVLAKQNLALRENVARLSDELQSIRKNNAAAMRQRDTDIAEREEAHVREVDFKNTEIQHLKRKLDENAQKRSQNESSSTHGQREAPAAAELDGSSQNLAASLDQVGKEQARQIAERDRWLQDLQNKYAKSTTEREQKHHRDIQTMREKIEEQEASMRNTIQKLQAEHQNVLLELERAHRDKLAGVIQEHGAKLRSQEENDAKREASHNDRLCSMDAQYREGMDAQMASMSQIVRDFEMEREALQQKLASLHEIVEAQDAKGRVFADEQRKKSEQAREQQALRFSAEREDYEAEIRHLKETISMYQDSEVERNLRDKKDQMPGEWVGEHDSTESSSRSLMKSQYLEGKGLSAENLNEVLRKDFCAAWPTFNEVSGQKSQEQVAAWVTNRFEKLTRAIIDAPQKSTKDGPESHEEVPRQTLQVASIQSDDSREVLKEALRELKQKHAAEILSMNEMSAMRLKEQEEEHQEALMDRSGEVEHFKNHLKRELDDLKQKHAAESSELAQTFEIKGKQAMVVFEREKLRLQSHIQELKAELSSEDQESLFASVLRGPPDKTDESIVQDFLSLQSMVQLVARSRLSTSERIDSLLAGIDARHTPEELKRSAVQHIIWARFHAAIFESPFRVFGPEGLILEQEWALYSGQDLASDSDQYVWPTTNFKSERWRSMNMSGCREALSRSLTQNDPRLRLKQGFSSTIESVTTALKADLYDLIDLESQEDTRKLVEKLAKRCAIMWTVFVAQHHRLMIQPRAPTDTSMTISALFESRSPLCVQPELRRYWGPDGLDSETFTTFAGCEGKTIDISETDSPSDPEYT